jgi:hypothetical protein
MPSRRSSKPAEPKAGTGLSVAGYSRAQPPAHRAICEALRRRIEREIPKARSKVWHGSPVWFVEENPVVGYTATRSGVNLLFWNGKAFDEPELKSGGKYQAAQATFTDLTELKVVPLGRWLKKARSDVFDSKSFFAKLRKQK